MAGLGAVGTLLGELSVVVALVDTSSRVRSGAVIMVTGLARLEGDREDNNDDDVDTGVEGGSWMRDLLALVMERVLGGEVRLVGIRFFVAL